MLVLGGGPRVVIEGTDFIISENLHNVIRVQLGV